MNKQGNKQNPIGGIEWTHVFGPGTGFTWNPITGCLHDCRWEMPNGEIAQCYAKSVAEGVAQAAYPHGFEYHQVHPDRLREPLLMQKPCGIFLDSMSDLMGHWVPDDQILTVLNICEKAPQHRFMLLTKNAPRLGNFYFPDNVWVGASSPPNFMFGKRLSYDQQRRMLHRTLDVLARVKAKVRWISAEPLSWDVSGILAAHDPVQWVVIGAASNGKTLYPPKAEDVAALLEVLDKQQVPVFYKGNMRSLPLAVQDWREEFPQV